MDSATLALTIAIIEQILKYGPTAVIQIAGAFQVETPTPGQIRALKIDKDPEEYFK